MEGIPLITCYLKGVQGMIQSPLLSLPIRPVRLPAAAKHESSVEYVRHPSSRPQPVERGRNQWLTKITSNDSFKEFNPGMFGE
jgi:hypothetical protein